MGKRSSGTKLPPGVRFVGTSVEINFQVRGERYQTTLPFPQNVAGAAAAAKTRSRLITKAKLGLLTADDINEAKGLPAINVAGGPLFYDYAEKYIKHSPANKDSRTGYARMLNQKWLPLFAAIPIAEITTRMLRDAIDDFDFATAKTKNNNLIPLRGVFELARQDEVIPANPMGIIKNDKVQEDDPDPFTRPEMETLLNWLSANTKSEPVYYNYFKLAFWTGCRPSELLALHWPDFDRFNNTLLISKSRVRGVEKNVTKTHTSRVIHLSRQAREALDAQREITSGRSHVFICPETDAPFFNEKPPRLRLVKAMDETGVRRRRAYNTRHTYATLLLTSGVNPFFAAGQMGHSLQMMLKRYAKWIDQDKSRQEIAKLDI